MSGIKTYQLEDIASKFLLLQGKCQDVLKQFPDSVFHTVVTSPPYWQQRDYFEPDQLGHESTFEEYVKNIVDIMKEVKRTLRKDGTVWFNIGDSYNNESGFCRATKGWKRQGRDKGSADKKAIIHPDVKKKELFGIPWRVALALQKDGWFLRCDIIWEKSNPMPDGAKDRPTHGHEYIFLLSKSSKYFYDYYRILENTEEHPNNIQSFGARDQKGTYRMDQDRTFRHYGKRNKRSVWKTSVSTFRGEHFGTYPPKLIESCIKASTSEKGCCVACGTPWIRIFEKVEVEKLASENEYIVKNRMEGRLDTISSIDYDLDAKGHGEQIMVKVLELHSKGWRKNCRCNVNETTNCLVLDPFSGTGTTGEVAMSYGQKYVGIELNPEYIDISRKRLGTDNMLIKEVFSINEIL